jgi:cellulose synthase/poly-beta-1,6-N-acetylglucosamine synthase-like glycosyltransferase/peptidoglycan/xylan/chitin deacetylase (PgdA/CDA1 family)
LARHRRDRAPRAHWLPLAALLLALAGLLTVHALAGGALGADDAPPIGSAGTVPPAARSGGPVIDPGRTPPTAARPPDRTLVLTFDDGPDPTWTPAVLDVLARHRVHATFFVTGTHAAQHPDLVRRIVAAGNEIGNHTATHVDLRAAGDLRTRMELRATDLAIAGAAGVEPTLVRPPYSATPDSLDDAAWTAATRLGAAGRLMVLADLDSADWQRPGADAVLANATPRDNRGAVLLMHDAGGDRAQTVAALDRLIPAMQARGWRMDTVGGALGLRGSMIRAVAPDRAGGLLLIGAVRVADAVAEALAWLLLAATALAGARTLVVLLTTAAHVRRRRRQPVPRWIRTPVTVIVPAYNEEAGIAGTVRSLVASRHPVEVIVVDDGSTDRTAAVVRGLRLPGVRLVRQTNAGKATALNTGLAVARTELVVMVDGDTMVEPTAVDRLVRHFADPRVGAVSGNAKVGNRTGLLGRWQHIEYVIGFNLDRRMYDVLECMPTVPGAVGAFRRSAVRRVGGVPEDTLAEDTDLTMALERDGWRVVYEEHARAWTEAPATLGALWKQRYRWCYGTLQASWKHRRALVERGQAGRLGRRGLPYLLLFQVLLPVLAPAVDIAAVFGLLTGQAVSTVLTWLGFLLLQAAPGAIAFRLDRERLRPLLVLPLQQIVYRQLMYLVVVQSVVTALAGVRLPWHKLERRGLTTTTHGPEALPARPPR